MTQNIINQLSVLQQFSGQRLPIDIVHRFSAFSGGSSHLIRLQKGSGGPASFEAVPRGGTASLLQNLQSRLRVCTLGPNQAFLMTRLNEALKGSSYPVLTAVLATAAGGVSFFAGLVFSAATVGVDLSRRQHDLLARDGDEIWNIEEIGKVKKNGQYVPTHVQSYCLIDPHRTAGQTNAKGYLLHESRIEVALD